MRRGLASLTGKQGQLTLPGAGPGGSSASPLPMRTKLHCFDLQIPHLCISHTCDMCPELQTKHTYLEVSLTNVNEISKHAKKGKGEITIL